MPAAPCTRPRGRPTSVRWTGSPTCAGSSRCASQEHTDEHGHVTSTLREWKRRDWGEGGHEFHWWCTDSADAFVGDDPVYVTLRDEIVEMIGEPVYQLLARQLKERGRRAVLPHPAVRR